jgi:tetratricopeptide (TPR) repeat protein
MRSHRYHFGKGCAVLLLAATTIAVCPAAFCASPARNFAAASRVTDGASAGVEEIAAWQARWELARVLSYLKRYDESIAEYRKVIQEKPALGEAREEMARVLFWQGKVEEALRELEGIPPGKISDATRELMADLYRSNKRYEKGEPLYLSILERSPDNHRVRLKLAEILSWAKKYDESLAEYRTILAKLPEDIQVRRKYAFVLIWAGRHAEAAQELKKTLP